MASWKKVVVSGSSAELSALLVNTSVTASIFSGSFTGSLQGTASYVTGGLFTSANPALTASYAITSSYSSVAQSVLGTITSAATASYVLPLTQSVIISGASAILSVTGSVSSTGGFTGSLFGTASYVTSSNVYGPNGANTILSSSYSLSSSYALTASYAGTLPFSLTAGIGLSGSSFNGSAASTFVVSGAAQLTDTRLIKWDGTANKFVNANITDNGTLVTVGSSTIDVRIPGNLTVAGTASFENTQNLFVADQFILLASGSNTAKDGGIIVAGANGNSGSAWYLETTNTGTYGRWATSVNLNASASDGTPSEYAVTVNVAASSGPSAAPVWGGSLTGSGNMWINNSTQEIFIYS